MPRENIILKELRSTDRSPKALRSFGLVMSVAALVLAGISYWKHQSVTSWNLGFAVAAVLFALVAWLFPTVLNRPHLAWMFLSLCLGWLMSRVILILLFTLVVIPTHLLGRICGLSFMDMRRGSAKESLWVKKKPRSRTHHEAPF
jgi:uncharacterized membrane protein